MSLSPVGSLHTVLELPESSDLRWGAASSAIVLEESTPKYRKAWRKLELGLAARVRVPVGSGLHRESRCEQDLQGAKPVLKRRTSYHCASCGETTHRHVDMVQKSEDMLAKPIGLPRVPSMYN